jgi:hypothetical protein
MFYMQLVQGSYVQTSVVCVQRPEARNWVVSPARTINIITSIKLTEILTTIARLPSSPECLRTSLHRTH